MPATAGAAWANPMKPDGEMLRRSEWCVHVVPMATCHRLIRQYHYAGIGGNNAVYRHGLFRRDDLLHCQGVAWWGMPTHSQAGASWSEGDWRQVLVLSRLVIAPNVPINGPSFLLAASVKMIRADGRFRCLITYADTMREHTGTIYRAANWEYMGLTSKPGPTWWNPTTNVMVSSRTGGGGGKQPNLSVAEMKGRGYVVVGHYPKHKFRMILPESHQRRGTRYSSMAFLFPIDE